ncbi:MAG: DUF2935 domain-containing protein [Bacillaceae bacterium]|nr:DUF2935 domain-containing protein [Bacillaceae bacterium]
MKDKKNVLDEHRFWLQILGDHARFIYHALSPSEKNEVQTARYFIHTFDELWHQSRQNLNSQELHVLNDRALRHAREIRLFKLKLLRRHLTEEISIGLSPTFINHMVNEVEEYLRILEYLVAGKVPPPAHPVHHHLLWLQDAVGHAATITCSLDFTEQKLRNKSETFTRHFQDFYLKAVEFAGYLRTSLKQFPALKRFNHQVELEMKMFQTFLHELEEMEMDETVLGTLSPLIADHMFREECYYLTRLAMVSEVEQPDCDPAHPRPEEK